jgi:hypothetical protein
VSSRQEEKEQRRRERLALEQSEARARARRTRLQYVFGGLLALAAAAAIVLILVSSGGGEDGGGEDGGPREADAADVTLPAQQAGDLTAAAKAAGCEVTHPEIEGANHLDKEFTAADYKTNPPTSGDHFAQWAEDGIYDAGNNPPLGMLVHTLEHGRINVQYKPGTPAATIAQLEALLAEQSEGYHMLLYENPTEMDAAVAATAWGHSVTCPRMSDEVFDVLRTFRGEYIDKGPENVP